MFASCKGPRGTLGPSRIPQGYSPIVQPDKLVGDVCNQRLQENPTRPPVRGFRVWVLGLRDLKP